MRYFTFKHKAGADGSYEEYVKRAIDRDCALMQQEYNRDVNRTVSANWNVIKNYIKEGDILFLRGDTKIYAYGKIIKHRKHHDVRLKMVDIINNNSHMVDGIDYSSDKYNGCIDFDDCSVFYEDLSDGPGEWGQRIDVEKWLCYHSEGVDCESNENYLDRAFYNIVRELKEDKAKEFIKRLKGKERFMTTEPHLRESLELLEENKNLILTGAPGTGKTYLARKLAKALISDGGVDIDVDEPNEQIGFVQFHPSYDYTDFVEGLRPIGSSENGIIGFERRDGVFKAFCKAAIEEPEKKFVFVIDEINRGEISKIFGELFFSIDPSYRGKDGIVQTQYANMNTKDENKDECEDDPFMDGFYVPENVYIIGTMNDIDRSVESFDFAMRRRFVWHEITADDSVTNMAEKLPSGAAIKIKNINNYISYIPELNSSYHIGATYFLPNDGKSKESFDYESLWKLRLEPLFKEYLRGMPNAETYIKTLYDAFRSDKIIDTTGQ